MVSSDARISTTLPSHPKTKKLIKRHGQGAAWNLVCLFLWAAANRSDGDLTGMSVEDIELAADWSGEDGAFVKALSDVGYLDGCDSSYIIHDWAEHNPWAAGAKDRSDAAAWAALCRRYGRDGAAERMPEYAQRMHTGCDQDADRMRPADEPHAGGTNPQCPVSVSVSVSESVTDSVSASGAGGFASQNEVDALLGKVTGRFTGRGPPNLPPEQRKAIWQSRICEEAQRTMPADKYAKWLDAYANGEPWAKRKAEEIDKQIKARKAA